MTSGNLVKGKTHNTLVLNFELANVTFTCGGHSLQMSRVDQFDEDPESQPATRPSLRMK